MAWRLAAALALAVALAFPVADAAICTMGGPYGTIQYECGGSDTASAPKDDGPWWASQSTQAILAFVGLAGSATAGGYAFYKVRARRKALTRMLLAIERAYGENKAAPEVGVPALVALRRELHERHQKGKLDDGHYLEMDKRATDYIVRLRVLDLDRRFLGLPPALMAEVRRLVGDGLVTPEDVVLVDRHALAFRVPEPRRSELVALVRSWSTEDEARETKLAPVESGSVPHKLLVR